MPFQGHITSCPIYSKKQCFLPEVDRKGTNTEWGCRPNLMRRNILTKIKKLDQYFISNTVSFIFLSI